jgi:hypothetical protein
MTQLRISRAVRFSKCTTHKRQRSRDFTYICNCRFNKWVCLWPETLLQVNNHKMSDRATIYNWNCSRTHMQGPKCNMQKMISSVHRFYIDLDLADKKQTLFYCDTCPRKPRLHPNNCFALHHTVKKYH